MPSNPYSSVSVSGYNSSPPPDDGSQVAANRITWSGIKTKLGDPLDTFAAAVDAAILAAFGSLVVTTDAGESNVILHMQQFGD